MELTQSIVKELLHYDPETGIFTWGRRDARHFKEECYCKTWNSKNAGKVTGTLYSGGYIYITIFTSNKRAHRLAWLYVYGEFPPEQIDHINGVRDDNRITNLRAVSHQENQRNSKLAKNNKSGFIGVYWSKGQEKWAAAIRHNGKPIFLGYFDDVTEAAARRKQAEIEYGYHPNHGRRQ